MDLVDRDRARKLPAFAAVRAAIRRSSPLVVVDVGDDRGGARALFGVEAVGVGLVGDVVCCSGI